MTRRFKNITIVAALLMLVVILSPGCTRNNGNIGSIFGTWRLDALEIDGEAASDYNDNCFWGFQNNIISFTTLDAPDEHSAVRRWGTFVKEDGYLILDLAHHGQGDNDYLYQPPAYLRLPCEKDVRLKIVSESGSKMVLTYTAAEGEIMTYKLIKQ